jgi:SAM-dependent methyltransferase
MDAVDFGRTADDYATHRAGFPACFYRELGERGVIRPGLRALDLGTGTGTLARELAREGCVVTGLDPSAAMLEAATRLDREAGVAVRHVVAKAEETGLADASFDLVSAGQCWHWFDGVRAAAECARLLVPGGRVVVGWFDWIPLPGNVVAATEALILRFNPAWSHGGGSGVHPACLAHLATAGFEELETFGFDVAQPYSHEAWRGRIRASAGVGASLPAAEVALFDAELSRTLARDFPQEPLGVRHRVFAVVASRGGRP